ncbi:unnamed protein product, partial [Mesorhabditis belari]|uniref:G-protein coupled receptors family 1 profile domain-containing protein n=1 Tax=Mesorhabditis belari TaxID=2138241 RepID=A0AAF3F2I1_9BILA
METLPENDENLTWCSACLGSTDPDYQTYNFAVSGVLLAVVGVIGLFGNILVVTVYLSRHHRIHSTSIYLASLALSDFFLIITAMFLFVLEAWRHHNYPLLAWLYTTGAPLIFPLAAVFQTSSVYLCVAAAVDCFITVVLPASVKQLYCTPRRARITVFWIMNFCIVYNIPHALEIEKVACIMDSGQISSQICPTDIRKNPAYYTIYYTYMYTTFLAVGPLILLILLNICVVYTVVTSEVDNGEESDTVSLILVVFFFIFCNFTALLVNFLELILPLTELIWQSNGTSKIPENLTLL